MNGVGFFTVSVGSFPLTVTVTTMGNRSYNSPLSKAPLRTVTERGNDPMYQVLDVGLRTCRAFEA